MQERLEKFQVGTGNNEGVRKADELIKVKTYLSKMLMRNGKNKFSSAGIV